MKASQLTALERLYKRRFPQDKAWSLEQARELALLSRSLNRQLGLLLDRHGRVKMVLAGDFSSIYIPQLANMRAGSQRLRGLRLIHTHLASEQISQEDLLDLLFLRLDAIAALGVNEDGEPQNWQCAWLAPKKDSGDPYIIDKVRKWHDAEFDFSALAASLEDEFGRLSTSSAQTDKRKRAVLISVSTAPVVIQERNLDELEKLIETAGLESGGRLIQRVAHPDPRFILGKGKLAELEILALNNDAEILVFDGELSPAQLNNLAEITERKALDRTQIILDIFAQHAVSRAGKLQVELAQLTYLQPRLAGSGKAFDRLMGGIGGRGPGETKLETDRRKNRERMAAIKREIKKLRAQRSFVRNRRKSNRIPTAALIGYTNAGKSTLLNILTKSDVLAANQLFATLDPVTRRFRFPDEKEITIADTVGFIRNLPKELKDAFQATLEELNEADILLHVADASNPELISQMASVEEILENLNLHEMPRILLLNKFDLLDAAAGRDLLQAYPHALPISAHTGAGLEALSGQLEMILYKRKASMVQKEREIGECLQTGQN